MIYLYKDLSYPQISKNIGKLTKMPSFYLTKKSGTLSLSMLVMGALALACTFQEVVADITLGMRLR